MKTKKIISWNINSIRARIDLLKTLIEQENPDVILLQETKVKDDLFPAHTLNTWGYKTKMLGEMRYNGVAILSKKAIENTSFLDHDRFEGRKDTRYIDGEIDGFTIASIYVPNGRELNHPHFHFKKSFYESLAKKASGYQGKNLILGGDYNIVPKSSGVWGGKKFDGQIICSDEERSWYKNLLDKASLIDIFDDIENDYTWWDYRYSGFQKNQGYKIDSFLVSKSVKVLEHKILKYMRGDKNIIKEHIPSDHAPISIIVEV